jgi:hypothetical protein
MRREPRAEPERLQLVPAGGLVPQPELDDLREQLRNRPRLDEINLPRHERSERLAIDRVLHSSSLPLIHINSDGTPKRARSAASPTWAVSSYVNSFTLVVHLRLLVRAVSP